MERDPEVSEMRELGRLERSRGDTSGAEYLLLVGLLVAFVLLTSFVLSRI